MQEQDFLRIVEGLQKVNVGIRGCNVWLYNNNLFQQIVIMFFDKDFYSDAPHKNICSQWGIVLDGEIILHTDVKQTLKRGDVFFIPKGTPHQVEIKAGYKDITFFYGLRYKK